MIRSRIIDNDMGSVIKVPLTGRGTIHGLTFTIDDQTMPEFQVGLLEMVAGDGGIELFKAHAMEHMENPLIVQKFIDRYKSWIEPILKSGKSRY